MASTPDPSRLMAALEATWAPAEIRQTDGWVLRRGAGGGKRVSAASGTGEAGDIDAAEAAQRAWDQPRLFQLTPGDAALDAQLAGRGYAIIDPTVFYAAPVAALTGDQSHLAAAYRCQFRPAIMEEIWEQGGIGSARRAITDRVTRPKLFLMSRADDTPAGVAFAAVDGEIAMIHAIEVLPGLRRRGAGVLLMELAARWAAEQNAAWLALAVTEANAPARTLYERLGMGEAGRYHYRIAKEDLG